ncbi:MAG: hypothetical protein IT271_12515 [Chitinophagales bacterium]|nr:hypothetical protein [Chitinophagales bacterium]
MKKGILLIALGHPIYLKMAENLAVTLIASNPDVKIALVVEEGVSVKLSRLFSKIIVAPKKCYTTAGKTEYIKAKTCIYDLTPFDKTIFLDVDMAWMKKPVNDLFDSLEAIPWTISNSGIATDSVWCNIENAKAAYGDQPFWNYSSEFIYFQKSKETKKYFETVKAVFENPKIDCTRFANSTMADELAFQLASMQTGQYPHVENFYPTFWYSREKTKSDKKKPVYKLYDIYAAYSIGGNMVPSVISENYMILVEAAYCKLKIPFLFKFKNKASYASGRAMI